MALESKKPSNVDESDENGLVIEPVDGGDGELDGFVVRIADLSEEHGDIQTGDAPLDREAPDGSVAETEGERRASTEAGAGTTVEGLGSTTDRDEDLTAG